MYDANSLVNRIEAIVKDKKIKKIEMLEACGCNRNTLTQLSDKKGLASFSLARIADYLDCSVDYLLGRTDDPQSHKTQGAANRWNEGIELEQRARPLAAQNNKSVDQ